jgi:hypothetical protein
MTRPHLLVLRTISVRLSTSAALALSVVSWTGAAQIPSDVVVHFGLNQFPQPAPGAPAAAFHVLVPDDVTIRKGGTVTFQVNGGGHGIAIYPVSRNTRREHIEEDLCPGGPGGVCTGATANIRYVITDGKGDLVIDSDVNPPENRVNYQPHRLMAAGAGSFLTGANPLATPPVPGNQVQYRFAKTGRFLVICMNRGHSLNDWMFGFVNVVGDDDDDDDEDNGGRHDHD